MEINTIFELPMFSATLKDDPSITFSGMDVIIELEGYDEFDNEFKSIIKFKEVLCYKRTSTRFTPDLFDAFDKVVEVRKSPWLEELHILNQEYFDMWKPNHYALYLSDNGLYQFIAAECEAF